MAQELLMGVDIGTGESKGVLCDAKGNIVAQGRQKHGMEMPRPGWYEHDVEAVWWGDFVKLARELLAASGARPADILGISVSGLGQDVISVDKDGRPTRRTAILYGIDIRANEEMEEMNRRLGRENILRRTANGISTHSVGPKIAWLRKHDRQAFDRADRFLTASSYLVAKLTGRFVLDHNQASFWVPLYDFEKRRWNEEFCREYLRVDQLAELKWQHEIAGHVTAQAARETGLAEGTPVCVGTGDAFAESLSVGALSPGNAMVMYGSTTCIFMPVETIKPDYNIWSYQSYDPGKYGISMCTATSGSITKWFRQMVLPEMAEDEAYTILSKEAAETPPGAGGVITLPYFSGERSPIYDPDAKGIFLGLGLSTTRGQLYRSIVEGIAYSVRHNLDVLNEMGYRAEKLIAVGGGIKNPVWLQAVSDICGMEQQIPRVTLGAAYADAFIAGVGAGLFEKMEDIAQWITYEGQVLPHQENKKQYEAGYQVYRRLYEDNRKAITTLQEAKQ